MFSIAEKKKIAEAVEKVLLELRHPEMPETRANFRLHVNGKEDRSFADILPNWTFEAIPPKANPWNEVAREVLAKPCPSCKEHEAVEMELAVELLQTECYGFEVACTGNGFNCKECPKVKACVEDKLAQARRRSATGGKG